jgi:hypothetical protein
LVKLQLLSSQPFLEALYGLLGIKRQGKQKGRKKKKYPNRLEKKDPL